MPGRDARPRRRSVELAVPQPSVPQGVERCVVGDPVQPWRVERRVGAQASPRTPARTSAAPRPPPAPGAGSAPSSAAAPPGNAPRSSRKPARTPPGRDPPAAYRSAPPGSAAGPADRAAISVSGHRVTLLKVEHAAGRTHDPSNLQPGCAPCSSPFSPSLPSRRPPLPRPPTRSTTRSRPPRHGTPICAKWVHDRHTVERGGRSLADLASAARSALRLRLRPRARLQPARLPLLQAHRHARLRPDRRHAGSESHTPASRSSSPTTTARDSPG